MTKGRLIDEQSGVGRTVVMRWTLVVIAIGGAAAFLAARVLLCLREGWRKRVAC